MLKKLAQIISVLTETYGILVISWLVVISSLPANIYDKIFWFVFVMLISGLPPFLVLLYGRATGKITDWFMTKREERKAVQFTWVAADFVLFLALFYFYAPPLLKAFGLAVLLVSLAAALITLYWKISVHLLGSSLLIISCIVLFGQVGLYTLLILPVVAWARLQLKHHTLTQVLAGGILGLLLTYFSYRLLGFVFL